jgi:hypothetical protein
MSRAPRKHVTSPREPGSDAGFEKPDGHLLHTHEAAGSSPELPATKPASIEELRRSPSGGRVSGKDRFACDLYSNRREGALLGR